MTAVRQHIADIDGGVDAGQWLNTHQPSQQPVNDQ